MQILILFALNLIFFPFNMPYSFLFCFVLFYQMQHFKFLTLQPVMDTLVNFLLPLNMK